MNVNLNVLNFWFQEQCHYHNVATTSLDLLSIPIYTFSSEFAFSICGSVVDGVHISLVPEFVETLICCKA